MTPATLPGSALVGTSSEQPLGFLEWSSISSAELKEYLMARPPLNAQPETDSVAEEASGAELDTESGCSLDLKDSIEMSGASGSGERRYGFGSDSSCKYSHQDTSPEKIQEKMKDLHDDMQDTLRRLDHLETKLKNGTGKKTKRPDSSSARRNEELQKALSKIMEDVNDSASR